MMKKYRLLILVALFYFALPFFYPNVARAAEVLWDGILGTTNASVDRTVFYGDAEYSIKLNNLDYSCAYVYKDFVVKPNSHYRATVMVKYEGYEIMEGKYDSGASIGSKSNATGMYRDNEWEKIVYDFDTAEDQTTVSIALWNGYYGADCKGCAYFSDFQLNEIEVKWDVVKGGTEAVVDYVEKYPGCDYSIKLINNDYYCSYIAKTFSLKPNTRYVASVMAKNVDYELRPDLSGYTGARMGIPDSFVGTDCYNKPVWKKLEFGFRTDDSGQMSIALWNGLFAGECKGITYYSGFKIEEYAVNVENPEGISKYFVQAESKINNTITENVDADYPSPSKIIEMIGNDGVFRAIYSDDNDVYIDLLDSSFHKTKTLRIRKELSKVGTAIMDDEGNYYIVYGETDTGETGTVPVMCVAKYLADGTLVAKTSYNGNETGFSEDELDYATCDPFAAASCSAAIDENGMLVVRYGRKMYCQHQSSHSLFVNIKTMEKESRDWNYTSHSYAQKVIATSDGGHLCAEMGDGFPRGMVISKVEKDGSLKSFVPFHFRSGLFYQRVYASIGGIAELSNGYALVGSSVNKLSCKSADTEEDLESRNIFMQIFDKNFTSSDTSNPDVHRIEGETRKPIETSYAVEHGCTPEDVDYGVKWITNYTDKTYASMVKMMKVSESSMLIIWEKKLRLSDSQSEYQGTYYCIVASNSEFITHPTLLGDIRISELTDPIYQDGYLYLIGVCEYNYKHGRGENEPSVYEISRVKLENPAIKNFKQATCTENGYTGDFTCKECGKVIMGSMVPALGHQPLKAVMENEAAATTEQDGSYDEVTYCKVCNVELTRVKKTIPKVALPTSEPSAAPTAAPAVAPTAAPTVAPTAAPTVAPIAAQTVKPTTVPSNKSETGDVIVDDKNGIKAEVIDAEKKEVCYVVPKSKSQTTITVLGTVKVKGITYKVTKINDGAFKRNKTVTKIVLPSSIKIIGKDAFNGCTKLKTITIPKNVTEIGANAFSGCKKLKTITVKTTKLTAKKVGKNAFKGTPKNATMKVPKKQFKTYKKFMKSKGFKGKLK